MPPNIKTWMRQVQSDARYYWLRFWYRKQPYKLLTLNVERSAEVFGRKLTDALQPMFKVFTKLVKEFNNANT